MSELPLFLALVAAIACAGLACPAPAAASGGDQGQARRALEKGEIRPLDQVLAAARAAVPGEVVKLDLKHKKEHWLYELKILTPEGKRREVKVDAATLAVVESEDDDDDD